MAVVGVGKVKAVDFTDSSSAALSYSNINRCEGGRLCIQSGDYQIFQSVYLEEDFIQIKNIKFTPYLIPERKTHTRGYKLFVVIDDSKLDDNLHHAWSIVCHVLIQYNVYFFKIIKNTSRAIFHANPATRGSIITIYAFKENRSDWSDIITTLTTLLEAQHIRPGKLSLHHIKIAGTEFLSYYNDGHPGEMNPFVKF